MLVIEVTFGLSLLAKRVHVIPRNYEMTIKSGIHLSSRLSPTMNRRLIDNFFASLVDNSGANAARIILSNAGTNGTQRLKTIK